jgi:general secretion pathway protein D
VLRLKDGENQILAGLINDEDRNSGNKVPALGDIPILGRLFGSQRDDAIKTEIVLSITPRIVRNPLRPSLAESEFDAGTEASLRNRGLEGAAPGLLVPTPLQIKPTPGLSPVQKPPTAPPAPGGAGGAPGAYPTPGPGAATPGGGGTIIGAPLGTVGGTVTGPTPFVTAGTTTMAFQGPAQAAAGTSFSLTLTVLPDQPITSMPFTLGYDPKRIEIASVTEGEFMRQGGASSSFTTQIDAASGRVLGTATRGSGDGASQVGTLLTLAVRALTANTSATVQLVAASPIGVGGRTVAFQAPAPYQLLITP